jgi:hypothetical protein
LILAAGLCTTTVAADAQERQLEIGLRPLVLLSQGEPSNDMAGAGIVGSWRWNDDWFLGIGLDSLSFDYERPQRVLGIQQDPDLATVDVVMKPMNGPQFGNSRRLPLMNRPRSGASPSRDRCVRHWL